MALKPEERDSILGRLDERSETLVRISDSQEKHLAFLNGSVVQLQVDNASLKTTIYGRGDDKGMVGKLNATAKTSKKTWVILVALIATLGSTGVLEWRNIIHIFGG